MRFKSLFLGALAAAALVGCNNESIEPVAGPAIEQGNSSVVPSTGKDTYFSMRLPIKESTYAGDDEVAAFEAEKQVKNAFVFVYKWNGSNATPEKYAFVDNFDPKATSPANKIVLKVKDGTKKIFAVLNSNGSGSFLATGLNPALATSSTVTTDPDGPVLDAGLTIDVINQKWWSHGESMINTTAPNSTSTNPGKADGLIKALAGGSMVLSQGVIFASGTSYDNYQAPTSGGFTQNSTFLMSNFDNVVNDITSNGDTIKSTCVFTLKPDISRSMAENGNQNEEATNNVTIEVQRAIAKVSLQINDRNRVAGTTPTMYNTTDQNGNEISDNSAGRFEPWQTNGDALWTLGNLNKVATIFQKFQGGSVADENYDSIKVDNPAWYVNFDNTRVFGNTPYGSATVSTTENAMKAQNAATTIGQFNYAYVPENAQSYPAGWEVNTTYWVVGGKYHPKKFVSDVQLAAVASNPPYIGYNDATIDKSSGQPNVQSGADYAPITYGTGNQPQDSLIYHLEWKEFFHGWDVLYKYYAWYKSGSATLNREGMSNPAADATIQAEIAQMVADKKLVVYNQGRCFYRAFIYEIDATTMNERVLVRRNHIYEVTVKNILGPGIADPNEIIVPDTPVLESDTYLAVQVDVKNWHKVGQEVNFGGN